MKRYGLIHHFIIYDIRDAGDYICLGTFAFFSSFIPKKICISYFFQYSNETKQLYAFENTQGTPLNCLTSDFRTEVFDFEKTYALELTNLSHLQWYALTEHAANSQTLTWEFYAFGKDKTTSTFF